MDELKPFAPRVVTEPILVYPRPLKSEGSATEDRTEKLSIGTRFSILSVEPSNGFLRLVNRDRTYKWALESEVRARSLGYPATP